MERLTTAVLFGIYSTVAIVFIFEVPMLAVFGLGGLMYLGYRAAEQLSYVNVVLLLLIAFLIPFAFWVILIYLYFYLIKFFGEWNAIGLVFGLASIAIYIFLSFRERNDDGVAKQKDDPWRR